MTRRLPLTVLLAALVAVLLVALPTSQAAKPKPKASTIAIRTAPAVVTVNEGNGAVEPTGVLATVSPAVAGRPVTIQRLTGGAWTTVRSATTDAKGRAFLKVVVTTLGTQQYRAKVAASKGYRATGWKTTSLYVRSNTACTPTIPLVDTSARGEASCLAARLDRWRSAGLMGIGQQLNISGADDAWLEPLAGIPAPAVVGFDLEELDQAATAEYPYEAGRIAKLIELAHRGTVLVASWHARNPVDPTLGSSSPRVALTRLVDPSTAAYANFWADWDAKLDLVKRLQDDDADGDGASDHDPCWCTPVVVRPLHEVNGDFFWWGKPDPAVYRQVWARLQQTAAAKDVHNVVWAYSGNRDTSSTNDPALYTPTKVDIGGLDSYDPEQGAGNAGDVLPLEGYAAIARKIGRMALTEVGPHGSADRAWNPAVIGTGVARARIAPLWSMLWFDDGTPAQARQDRTSGFKQLNSLLGGGNWMKTCFANALCPLR